MSLRTELAAVDQVRLDANKHLAKSRKVELGQFMTPSSVAEFMASLFSQPDGTVRLLDAGAGSLTDAFVKRWGSEGLSVSAYEIDQDLSVYLRERLDSYGNGSFEAALIDRDFIRDAVYRITLGEKGQRFTRAILNPPYRKIGSHSEHRALLRAVGLETVNLYTAFVGLAIELMAEGGEIIAIIPRSFCNGLYYKPFREWMLAKSSVEHIHLFHSRTSAFNDDEVLQENVILKLVCGKRQGKVRITTSSDTYFSDIESNEYPFSEIVHLADSQKFNTYTAVAFPQRHRRTSASHAVSGKELGLEVSAGPVVDFRLKEFLRKQPESGAVPLLYPVHFANGALEWPKRSKKPNAIVITPLPRSGFTPTGTTLSFAAFRLKRSAAESWRT